MECVGGGGWRVCGGWVGWGGLECVCGGGVESVGGVGVGCVGGGEVKGGSGERTRANHALHPRPCTPTYTH